MTSRRKSSFENLRAAPAALAALLSGCAAQGVPPETPGGLPVTQMRWRVETVAEAAGGPSALALDSSGAPRLAFVAPEGLRYAERVGSDWRIQTVAESPGEAKAAALALEAGDRPLIGYLEGDAPKSARWDGVRWLIQTVDPDPGLHAQTVSLAQGPDGVAHIAFTDPDSCILWHAALRRDGWRGEAVVSVCGGLARGNEYVSLQVARDGTPRAAYNFYNGSVGTYLRMDLKYASWNGSDWVPQMVDADGMGLCPSLALDATGSPRIAYWDPIRGALKYAGLRDGRWEIQTVDADEGLGCGWSSLALDAEGTAHVAYLHNLTRQVRYARGGGRHWIRSVVDSVEKGAGFTSLRLDARGAPRLAYYDGRAYKYAELDSR